MGFDLYLLIFMPLTISVPVFLSINYNAASTDFPLLSIPDTRHLTRLTIQTVLFRFSKLSRETEHFNQTQNLFITSCNLHLEKMDFLKKISLQPDGANV